MTTQAISRLDLDVAMLVEVAQGRNCVENLVRGGPGGEIRRTATLGRLVSAGLVTWEPTHSNSGYYEITSLGRTVLGRLAMAACEEGPDWAAAAEQCDVDAPTVDYDIRCERRARAHDAARAAVLASAGL